MPTLVIEYDTILSQPQAGVATIVTFLDQLGLDISPELEKTAASWIDPGLRHHNEASESDEFFQMAHVQRDMFEQLSLRAGIHDAWDPPQDFLPAPLWVDDVIQLRRDFDLIRREWKRFRKSRLYRTASTVKRLTSR